MITFRLHAIRIRNNNVPCLRIHMLFEYSLLNLRNIIFNEFLTHQRWIQRGRKNYYWHAKFYGVYINGLITAVAEKLRLLDHNIIQQYHSI